LQDFQYLPVKTIQFHLFAFNLYIVGRVCQKSEKIGKQRNHLS